MRKHDLIYFKEPSSLKDAIDTFYEGVDTFLQSFSDLLVEKSNYPEKPFRLTESFLLRALRKIESSAEVLSIIVLDDSELEISQRLVSHERLRELVLEIFRDGENLKFSIERIKKKDRKIVNAKIFNIFTREQLT